MIYFVCIGISLQDLKYKFNIQLIFPCFKINFEKTHEYVQEYSEIKRTTLLTTHLNGKVEKDNMIYKQRLDTLLFESKTYKQANQINPQKLAGFLDEIIKDNEPIPSQTTDKEKRKEQEL